MKLSPSIPFTHIIAACVFLALSCGLASGQTYQILYNFGTNAHDGAYPNGKLVFDPEGNLYGVTGASGAKFQGTVFKLSPQIDGTWLETTIYNFCSDAWDGICRDGQWPNGSLAIDAAGNLYGTTVEGGTRCGYRDGRHGCGVLYELSPPHSGRKWTYTVLNTFCAVNCVGGAFPASGLTLDADGNLYGITSEGGSGHRSAGVVFEFSPGASGWTETVLYSFCSVGENYYCADGSTPTGGVTFDGAGNLYGTTENGTKWQHGVIFELSPNGNGSWTESLAHTFYTDWSYGPVGFDKSGNLYDVAYDGVRTYPEDSQDNKFVAFPPNVGSYGLGGPLVDIDRHVLFGVTENGGTNGAGSIWQADDHGQIIPLYEFCSQPNCTDGGEPRGGLIEDAIGNLYGVADGGNLGKGVVFELTP